MCVQGSQSVPQPNYGIDAPNLCRGFLLGGGAMLAAFAAQRIWLPDGILRWAGAAALIAGIYLTGMGLLMVTWSRIKKVRDREVLIDSLKLRSDAQVLDVGCGRGLLMIGAALRLSNGRATGIDIWSNVDQSGNTPEATAENARRAGVSDRVSILTGDMRKLPFEDGAFDAVMSHWVIHNLEAETDRTVSIDEMIRVIAPGGKLLIADIANRDAYRAQLTARGMTDVATIASPWQDRIMAGLTFGSFVPGAIVATKSV